MRFNTLDQIYDIVRALKHPLRIRILQVLAQPERINVRKLYETLGIEQSVASQQLRILRSAGLITFTMDGKNKYYKVDEKFYFLIKDNFEKICSYE